MIRTDHQDPMLADILHELPIHLSHVCPRPRMWSIGDPDSFTLKTGRHSLGAHLSKIVQEVRVQHLVKSCIIHSGQIVSAQGFARDPQSLCRVLHSARSPQ